MITSSGFFSHTNVLLIDLKILKLPDLFKHRIGIYIYKTLHIPDFDPVLLLYINSHTNQHLHCTRNISLITKPLFRKTKCQSCIRFIGSQIWNSVGLETKSASSLHSFNYLFKNELLNSYSCLLYTSPSPRDKRQSRMPSSA